MNNLLSVALCEYGVQEIIGGMHNPQILKYFKVSGHNWVKDDETAWCSSFINYVAIKSGHEASMKLNARSWLDIGTPTSNPVIGDIVIYWRGSRDSWKGHVGIFINYDEDGININTLGGNQKNSVCIMGYDKGRLLGFRKLNKLANDNTC